MRLTLMMLSIFLCFLVSFLPLMLVNVADDEMRVPTLHVIASVLAWGSAIVNPFIYAFKNRQYQQAFARVSTIVNCHTTHRRLDFHLEIKTKKADDSARNKVADKLKIYLSI